MGDATARTSAASRTASLARRLRTADPRDLASWLSQGDPLEIESRCAMRIRERRFLIDPETCHARAVARAATSGAGYDAAQPISEWVLEKIDQAIDDLLERDRRELEAGLVPTEPLEPRFSYLSNALGIEGATALSAAVAFNDLPFEDRDGFFALCIECRSVEECLEAGMGPPDLLRERTNRALDTIAHCAWGTDEEDEG